MNRRNDNFDESQHNYNIQRRIMERNFGQNSKGDNNENMRPYNQFMNIEDNKGEITGEFLDPTQLDKGMPFRPKMTIATDRFAFDDNDIEKQTEMNPHLDFNLYDTKPNMQVSYFDPFSTSKSTIGHSNINDNSNILQKMESNTNELLLSENINIFTFDFIHKFIENIKTSKSLILSPFNILQSFCLLYIGSKNNTEKELENFFSLPNKKMTFSSLFKINQYIEKSNAFTMLNLICLPHFITLNDAYVSYINKLGQFIKFDPTKSNYEANKINDIISKSTNHIIKNIIQPQMLTTNNLLKIINVTHFRSYWKHSFNPKNTKLSTFNGINKQQVMMMTQFNKQHRYFEDSNNQILEMDYADNLFTMGFILPKNQYNEAMITHEQFEYYVKNLKETQINVIKIPKFVHESKYRIDNLFRKFGLKEVFTNINIGDIIPPMSEFRTAISEIVHISVVTVNEFGNTSKDNSFGFNDSKPNKKINFIANYQFLYYIRFKPYNTLIFIGQHN